MTLIPMDLIRISESPKKSPTGCDFAQPESQPNSHMTSMQKPIQLLRKVVLRVVNPGAGGHELHAAPAQGLLGAHGVLMGQVAIYDEGHDLHIPVRMFTKTPLSLHQVVVHHPKHPETAGALAVLGEVEVKPGLQPVLIGPPLCFHISWIARVSKPSRIRFTREETALGNDRDVSRHGHDLGNDSDSGHDWDCRRHLCNSNALDQVLSPNSRSTKRRLCLSTSRLVLSVYLSVNPKFDPLTASCTKCREACQLPVIRQEGPTGQQEDQDRMWFFF